MTIAIFGASGRVTHIEVPSCQEGNAHRRKIVGSRQIDDGPDGVGQRAAADLRHTVDEGVEVADRSHDRHGHRLRGRHRSQLLEHSPARLPSLLAVLPDERSIDGEHQDVTPVVFGLLRRALMNYFAQQRYRD